MGGVLGLCFFSSPHVWDSVFWGGGKNSGPPCTCKCNAKNINFFSSQKLTITKIYPIIDKNGKHNPEPTHTAGARRGWS